MILDYFYDEDRFKSFDEIKISKWISIVCKEEKKVIGEIVYFFVSEEKILEINQKYLAHNFYTDIITFDSSLVNIINGEIYISPDTVLTNSDNFATTFETELYRVIIHGIIHLCGYTDISEKAKKIMRSKENLYLAYLDKL